MRKSRTMTPDQFATIRPLLRITAERIEAARAFLVDGETLRVIGERFGWSRQAVDDAVRIVWTTYQKYQEGQSHDAEVLPDGWEEVTLVAPKEMAANFRAQVAVARRYLETDIKMPGANAGLNSQRKRTENS